LRGVIYHGEGHFTSRIFTPDGEIWFRDGITTRSFTRYDGNLVDVSLLSSLHP
ncbi:hypothetical protein C8J57DRAFT_1089612, partial [Mycena rebaudengoi]